MLNRIRELRKQKCITLKQLGSALGLAESTISQYETGKREPDIKTLLRISEYFGVRIEDIVGLEAFDSGEEFQARWKEITQQSNDPGVETQHKAGGSQIIIDRRKEKLDGIYNQLDDMGQLQLIKYGEFLLDDPKYKDDLPQD